jgi:hypothetical protein
VAKSDDFRNSFLWGNFGTPLVAPHFNHETFFYKENHLLKKLKFSFCTKADIWQIRWRGVNNHFVLVRTFWEQTNLPKVPPSLRHFHLSVLFVDSKFPISSSLVRRCPLPRFLLPFVFISPLLLCDAIRLSSLARSLLLLLSWALYALVRGFLTLATWHNGASQQEYNPLSLPCRSTTLKFFSASKLRYGLWSKPLSVQLLCLAVFLSLKKEESLVQRAVSWRISDFRVTDLEFSSVYYLSVDPL